MGMVYHESACLLSVHVASGWSPGTVLLHCPGMEDDHGRCSPRGQAWPRRALRLAACALVLVLGPVTYVAEAHALIVYSSVCFVTRKLGWATGFDLRLGRAVVMRSNTYGQSWVRLSSQRSFGGAVHFASGSTGWWINGWVLKTTTGGRTWMRQRSSIPAKAQLGDGAFLPDARTGWVGGSYNGGLGTVVLHTVDGGRSWHQQLVDRTSRGGSIVEVRFVDAQHGWVLAANGAAWRTLDGGRHWLRLPYTYTKALRCIAFATANDGWGVGDYGRIMMTTDGGRHWVRQSSGTRIELLSVDFAIDARSGWAVGAAGTIVATTDGGRHWAHQRSGTKRVLSCVDFFDANRGWAVGDYSTVLRTVSAGRVWVH
jgi:photosystem II stability/assembly factor-like uncharacterized protein